MRDFAEVDEGEPAVEGTEVVEAERAMGEPTGAGRVEDGISPEPAEEDAEVGAAEAPSGSAPSEEEDPCSELVDKAEPCGVEAGEDCAELAGLPLPPPPGALGSSMSGKSAR